MRTSIHTGKAWHKIYTLRVDHEHIHPRQNATGDGRYAANAVSIEGSLGKLCLPEKRREPR